MAKTIDSGGDDMGTVATTGWLYFVEMTNPACAYSDNEHDFIKVGYASGLRPRLAVLRTSTPLATRLIQAFRGTKEDERLVHTALKDYRITREWYRSCDEVWDMIESLDSWTIEATLRDAEQAGTVPEDWLRQATNYPVSEFIPAYIWNLQKRPAGTA
jgi:hypothetical protein